MRRSLLLLTLLARPTLAQEEPGPAAVTVDPPEAAKARPTAAPSPTERAEVLERATQFFTTLLAGDARGLIGKSAFPFQLEDRKLAGPEDLFREWLTVVRTKRTDLVPLYGVEVLTPAEMEKRHGKPPARLKAFPWAAARTYLAVGNLGGHGAVAVLRETPGGWRVVGYTD